MVHANIVVNNIAIPYLISFLITLAMKKKLDTPLVRAQGCFWAALSGNEHKVTLVTERMLHSQHVLLVQWGRNLGLY